MSDLRFARELGAEFGRLERAAAASSRPRGFLSATGRMTGRIALAVAAAVPVAIVVVAIALVGISHKHGGHHSATGVGPAAAGLALSGGNCRIPARTAPHGPPVIGPAGLIRASSGRVSGLAWQLRVKPDTALPGAVEHGRLLLGGVQYGLCSRQSVPVPFGLVNAGSHGIVYGYVGRGGGSYRITVSAGNTPLTSSVADLYFFIRELPRPACAYRALTITATSTPVTGLPSGIARSLDDDPTQLTTTMRFGACRPHALVTATSEHGESHGRNPNASLATVTAQLSLIAPPGSGSRAGGRVWELTHDGQRGVNLFAFGLRPGRYGVWLLGPRGRTTALGAVNVKHDEILKSYDVPADVRGRQIAVAVAVAPGRGHMDAPGTIVLRATLR
jgi:hypothetical protein